MQDWLSSFYSKKKKSCAFVKSEKESVWMDYIHLVLKVFINGGIC